MVNHSLMNSPTTDTSIKPGNTDLQLASKPQNITRNKLQITVLGDRSILHEQFA